LPIDAYDLFMGFLDASAPVKRRNAFPVPGQRMWCARRVQRRGRLVAVRARHRLLPWQTITVETRDLRYGAEAVARYLSGRYAGFPVDDSRVRRQQPRHAASRAR
jgi:hypothetical protein